MGHKYSLVCYLYALSSPDESPGPCSLQFLFARGNWWGKTTGEQFRFVTQCRCLIITGCGFLLAVLWDIPITI